MKKNLLYICGLAILLGNSSCEDFLDKSPNLGLTTSDVYKDYYSIRGYLDNSYQYLENFYKYNGCNNERTHIGAISDEFASIYNSSQAITVNNGNWLSKSITSFEIGNSSSGGGTSIWKSYKGIRIVNRIIRDIDLVKDLSDTQKNEILGQAYFYRAWWYFQLIKRYGGMPKFDKLFSGDGTEDIPRMTYHESHEWMMSDIENAIAMLPDAWDTDNTGRPNKITAMAFKAMAQLYDASPLMQNDLKTIKVMEYDKERAKLAAQSAWAVIKYAEQDHSELGYRLMTGDEYKNIFYWTAPPYMQPEYLWYNRSQEGQDSYNYSRYIRSFWIPAEFASGTGNDAVVYNAPTQNMVEMFEKKGDDGVYYPITDPRSGYNLQEYQKDRDPRFYNNILCPGDEWGVNKEGVKQYITTYVDGATYNNTIKSQHSNKRQQTGYICKKFLWPECNQWTLGYNLYRTITVFIRYTQMYLDLAEASFEATGDANAIIEGCGLSAKQALDIVRARVGVTPIPEDIANDPTKFRDAYRRERAVELMFENNRWWDIRRWMIAHELFKEQYPIKGLKATKKNDGTFSYEVIDVVPEQRVFEMRNYWYPFAMDDVAALYNLTQNPGW